MFNNVIFDNDKGVATLTFNRPRKYLMDSIFQCVRKCWEAIRIVAENATTKVLIIKSQWSNFSVGGDGSEMQRAVEEDDVHPG